MAGNTIYMQEGSNYIDIHDNEVVNLSVDKGTVSVDKGDIAQSKTNGKGGRPKRAGKIINKAFIYNAGSETNTRLQLFYRGLKALKWIKDDTDIKHFLSVFSGKETTCRIVWTGDVNALAELFQELINRKKIIKLQQGETIWVMVNARFWDHKGNKEFGNERLGSTRAPIDSKDYIDQLVEILNPETDLDEVKERMQSQ